MDGTVEIQVDNTRFVELLRAGHGSTGSVVLTTKEARQERAIVQVFLRADLKGRVPLLTVEIKDIPAEPARPRIEVAGRLRGKALVLELSLNGIPYAMERVRLPREKQGTVPLFVAVGAAAFIVAIVLLGVLVLGSTPPTTQKTPVTTPAPPVQKAAPLPSNEAKAVPATPEAKPVAISPKSEETARAERTWEIYFLPDNVQLTEKALSDLSAITDQLRGDKILNASIVGHCALAGTEAGRTEISVGRAKNVYGYLENHLVSLPADKITVRGVGASEPVTLDPAKQYLNRRVQMVVQYENQ